MTAPDAVSHPHHDDHGHSWPAWVTVGIMAIGTVVSAIAFPLTSQFVFWLGVAIIVLGGVVGYVWSKSGESAALPRYTDTTPEATNVEGPTRAAEGTNRP